LKTEWRRRTGAGSRGGGTAARVAARPRGEEEGGGGPEEGGEPDRWAPPVGEREREERREEAAEWAAWAEKRTWAAGLSELLVFFLFLFFSNPFQTKFKFKSFHLFKLKF
jgi:hypothetical protein